MAGLCEACSHIGAVLFAIEAGVRMRDSVTWTQGQSKWVMPGHVKEIPCKPGSEIDFSSAKQKFRRILLKPCPAVASNLMMNKFVSDSFRIFQEEY